MAENENALVEIQDLMVNFYTYQGIVKAIDGINLVIRRNETLGLVGETGCGKSVTASAIMKLILSPPGKIEQGSVHFLEPIEVRKKRKEYEAQAQAWWNNLKGDSKRQYAIENLPRFTGFKKRIKPMTAEETKKIVIPKNIPHKLRVSWMKSKVKEISKTDKQSIEALNLMYDLIPKTNQYMEKIRGKYISMIFQEPTSALNPVFTAGDQIAEVILLHQKKELAGRIKVRLNTEVKLMKEKNRPVKLHVNAKKCAKCGVELSESAKQCHLCKGAEFSTEKGSRRIMSCSLCGNPVKKEDNWCDNCGNEFYSAFSWQLRRYFVRRYSSIFASIEKNPDSKYVQTMSRIPLVRRFKDDLYEEAMRDAVSMLKIVRIPDPKAIAYRYPHELSGGMQQRVMIAIALSCNPKLLIADEPTTALDVTIQAQILKLMRDLKAEYGSSILLITHNLGVVAEMCDRVGVMYAGSMAEIGDSRSIFKHPMHPYTIGLMRAVPSVQMDADRLFTITGSVPNLIRPPPGCRFNVRCSYAKQYCREIKPELVEIEPDHFVACHKVAGVNEYAQSKP